MVLEAEISPAPAETSHLTADGLRSFILRLRTIDQTKKQHDLSQTGSTADVTELLEEKDTIIDEYLLPARYNQTVPTDCSIKVGLLIDERGREWKDLVEIKVTANGDSYETRAPTPKYRKNDKGERMAELIGDYDYRLPRAKDNAILHPSLPRKGR